MTDAPSGKKTPPDPVVLDKLRELLASVGVRREALDKAGPDDNLFDLGVLDSIALVRALAGIEKAFEVRIGTGDFEPWNFQTLAAIARLIERLRVK